MEVSFGLNWCWMEQRTRLEMANGVKRNTSYTRLYGGAGGNVTRLSLVVYGMSKPSHPIGHCIYRRLRVDSHS